MKYVFLFIIVLLLLTGCSQSVPKGYVKVEDANNCVDIANALINITNSCFSQVNVTRLPPMRYFS